MSDELVLTKHEGAGNDFLVVVEGPGGAGVDGVDGAVARALCDRRRGVGADGLVLVRRGTAGADLAMDLWNADGSEAEMSGNGIRCLAQAAVQAGLVGPPRFTVATGAGLRTVDYRTGPDPDAATASVDMGAVRLGAARTVAGHRARDAHVGNPHVVVLVDGALDEVHLEQLAAAAGAGVNVEVVTPAAGGLALRVWERGVGETLACGTGSCAAAAAARAWGLVGDDIPVANPGGTLDVHLDGVGGAVLAGPVRRIAEVRVPLPRPVTAAR